MFDSPENSVLFQTWLRLQYEIKLFFAERILLHTFVTTAFMLWVRV